MGGGIALRIALAHSSRVTGLVLMATTASGGTPESKGSIIQFRDRWFSTPTPSEQIMDATIRSFGGDPDINPARVQEIKQDWVQRPWGPHRLGDVMESVVNREGLLGRLHEITVPVLIVHGEKDTTWPLEHALDIQKGLTNSKATLEVIKGTGHLVLWIRDSEDVSRMIAEFVNKEVSKGK
jgi:3-oxoadipate enol-lactonase